MRTLVFNSALFVLPLIVLMFIADWFLSYRLKHSREGEYGVWNDIYDGKINADIAIYGSSRAMVHLDPSIIKDSLNLDAYNLGINGHNFWLQYLRHKELLKYNKSPKIIIHSVDVFTLVKRKDLFNNEQFLPYILYNYDMKDWLSSYHGFSKFDYFIPLIRYYGHFKTIGNVLKGTVMPTGKKVRHLGFASKDIQWNDDLELARKKFPDYRVKLDTTSIRLFDQYLRECRKAGIHVILVYSPEYIEGQDFVKNRAEILNTFSVFASKYNIPFLDYSNDPISYQKEYFYNASHLNGKGAAVFTTKLIQDMKSKESIAKIFAPETGYKMHQARLEAETIEILIN